jgi:hypothetical protein
MDSFTDRLIFHAALSGPFEPLRFRYWTPAEQAALILRVPAKLRGRARVVRAAREENDDWSAALAQLAPQCDEILDGGTYKWVMRTSERRRVLATFAGRHNLLKQLWRSRAPRHDDLFGRLLRDCLTLNHPLSPDGLRPKDLRSAISASIFAQSILTIPRRDEVKVFERALYAQALVAAEQAKLKAVLPTDFVGRAGEIDAMANFLGQGIVEPPLKSTGSAKAPRRLLLTGSPGLGKSAFLSALVGRLKSEAGAPYVVSLDFDQFTLSRGNAIAWMEELTRQIGKQADSVNADLDRVRRFHSAQRAATTNQSDPESAAARLLADAGPCLASLPQRPIVLLADTIEEIIARDPRERFENAPRNTLFHRFITWAETLGGVPASNMFPWVRLVCSGRTGPPAATDVLKDWFEAVLELPLLDDAASEALLASRDSTLSETAREGIVNAVGGHPLLLLLVQRHLLGLRTAERAEVIEGLEKAGLRGALPADALRTLYSRFIKRLRIKGLPAGMTEEQFQLLAFPGLLLREVTSDLLSAVIGPAVGVDLKDAAVASGALQALREQVWLVLPGDGATLRHRPDVRHVMLPLMLPNVAHDGPVATVGADPELAAQARRVLNLGIAWYESHQTEPGAREEAGYLRALRGQPKDIAHFRNDPSLSLSVGSAAGEDRFVFPIESLAILNYLSDGRQPLSAAEIAALPEDLRFEVTVRQESAALKSFGGTEAFQMPSTAATSLADGVAVTALSAAELFFQGQTSQDAYGILNNRGLHDAIEVAFLRADFAAVSDWGWTALRRIDHWPDLAKPLGISGEFQSSWLWRTALASVVARSAQAQPFLPAMGPLPGESGAPSAASVFDMSAGVRDIEALMDLTWAGNAPSLLGENPLPHSEVEISLGAPVRVTDFREMRMLAASSVSRRALVVRGAWSSFTRISAALPLLDRRAASLVPGAEASQSELAGMLQDLWSSGESGDSALIESLFDRLDLLTFESEGQLHKFKMVSRLDQSSRTALDLLVRGTTPELHTTLATSLMQRPTAEILAAVKVISGRALYWPKGLTRTVGSSGRLEGSPKLAAMHRLIRFVDLCGLLTVFVADLADRSKATDLGAVARLLQELDRRWVVPEL